jgi:hypothetical protein
MEKKPVMNKKILTLGLFIAIFALASCSPALPAANSAYPAASAQPGAGNAYPPASGQPADENAYPTFQVQAGPAYPDTTETNLTLPPEPPATAPEPAAGKASISGALYAGTSKMRIAGTYAYLALAPDKAKNGPDPLLAGPKKEAGDIAFTTDDKGNFEINNIPPGRYILVVWAPYTWDFAQASEMDTTTMIIDLKPDTKTPLGVIYVAWP